MTTEPTQEPIQEPNQDNSTIDNKSSDKLPTSSFFKSLFIQIFNLFLLIFIGLAILYNTKVSQSNIIPTDVNCQPYDINKSEINKIDINVDVMKSNNNGNYEVKSTKITFPYTKNINIINNSSLGLKYLKTWKYMENTNPFYIYIATIQSKLFSNSFSMYNNIFNVINQTCSDSVIVFLLPLIFLLIVFIIGIINSVYFVYLYFFELYLLFSSKKEFKIENVMDENGKQVFINNIELKEKLVKWEYEKGAIFKNWYNPFLFIFFVNIAFMLLLLFSFMIPLIPFFLLIVSFKSFFLPLFLVGEVSNSNKEKYTFYNLITNFLKNRMNILMYIISFFVIIDAYISIGNYGLLISIIACIFIYMFYPEIYKKTVLLNNNSTPGLTTYNTALKKCIINDFNGTKYGVEKKQTWFEWIMSFIKPQIEIINNGILNELDELNNSTKRRSKRIDSVSKVSVSKVSEPKVAENKVSVSKVSEPKI